MSDEDIPNIAVRENAFLRAANIPNLKDRDGSSIETRPVMALCRCGQSGNKPFCDGAHKRVGFDSSAANSQNDKIYSYAGAGIEVHYSKLLCSHAAECGRLLSKVFDPKQRPWIRPDNGTVEEIKEVVQACPSGALRYSLSDDQPQHLVGDEVGIRIQQNGPFWVSNIPLDGETASANGAGDKYVLCRCGLSQNKPYCDGSHMDAGWKDD